MLNCRTSLLQATNDGHRRYDIQFSTANVVYDSHDIQFITAEDALNYVMADNDPDFENFASESESFDSFGSSDNENTENAPNGQSDKKNPNKKRNQNNGRPKACCN